jgi:integrase
MFASTNGISMILLHQGTRPHAQAMVTLARTGGRSGIVRLSRAFRNVSRNRNARTTADIAVSRLITSDEERRLLAAASDNLKPLIIAALDSGLRRGEMLALTWADVDAQPGWLRLRGETTKSVLPGGVGRHEAARSRHQAATRRRREGQWPVNPRVPGRLAPGRLAMARPAASSTRVGSPSAPCRCRRFGICSVTRRSSQPSATTRRGPRR